MWFKAKIAAGAICFVIRLLRLAPGTLAWPAGRIDGEPFYHSHRKRSRGLPPRHRVGIKIKNAPVFAIHLESESCRTIKELGLASEFQTQDPAFDDALYLTSDHPGFNHLLAQVPELRARIRELLSNHWFRPMIWCTGSRLWIEIHGDMANPARFAKPLLALRNEIHQATLRLPMAPFWRDPFALKYRLFESLIAAFGGIAVFHAAEFLVGGRDLHASHLKLFAAAAVCGLLIALAVYALFRQWLSASSRGARIWLESGIILPFALPLVALALTSHVNTMMDTGPDVVEIRKVTGRSRRGDWLRSGKKRLEYTYSLSIAPASTPDSPIPEARSITVDKGFYSALESTPNPEVQLRLGRGFLGIPWFKSMKIVNSSPTAGQ